MMMTNRRAVASYAPVIVIALVQTVELCILALKYKYRTYSQRRPLAVLATRRRYLAKILPWYNTVEQGRI